MQLQRLRSLALVALASAFMPSTPAAQFELDQWSPYGPAWLYCYEPVNVWQQQARVGITGRFEAFEITVVGPVGAQLDLRLRLGDAWSASPAFWSTHVTKTTGSTEILLYDVSGLGLDLADGDTFVIEAQGNDTGAQLRGSYVNPLSGDPSYAEELYLSGVPYDNGGYRVAFRTWMRRTPQAVVRVGSPPNPNVLQPGPLGGPASAAVWQPFIDHTAFMPGALLDVLVLGLVPGEFNLATPYGTLLYDPSISPLLFTAAPGAPFAVPIPNDLELLGLQLPTQGLSLDGVAIELTNALDITIGSL